MAASEVKADITGLVIRIEAKLGDTLAQDDAIVILESMKMEIPVPAPRGGILLEVLVAEGDTVSEGDVVAVIDG